MTLNGCVSPAPSIYFPPPPASSGNVNGVGKQRDYFGNGYRDGELQAQGQGWSGNAQIQTQYCTGGVVGGAAAGEPNSGLPPAVPKAWK